MVNKKETLTNGQCLLSVTVLVDKDVADALTVAEHGDGAGLVLDGPDQLTRPPRDDQVNVLVQLYQVLDVLTTTHLERDELLISSTINLIYLG